MSNEETNRRIDAAFNDPRVIQTAISRGIADARERYAQAGHPMATWRDGKVIWVHPLTGNEVARPVRANPRN